MKKGALEIGFGVIFGIIILVFVIAGIAWIIFSFSNTKGCLDTSLMYDQLNKKVDTAWKSDLFSQNVTLSVKRGIDYVCFGNVKYADQNNEIENAVRIYGNSNSNVFFYPNGEGCSETSDFKIDHLDVNGFFCLEVNNFRVNVFVKKGTFDSNAKICIDDCEISDISNVANETSVIGSNRTNIDYCQRAEDGGLCDGLVIVYGNLYKDRCCSEHNLCCQNE